VIGVYGKRNVKDIVWVRSLSNGTWVKITSKGTVTYVRYKL
jgi:hypothetical protein